jgi:ABC-type multidrug transport system fused ATPase/permease subunit
VALTNGFDTQCGIKGGKLSGGQKQRIAIARAVVRKPSILILDEATSALDEESQKKVQEALDNVMADRTSIVIAHRLTTVEKCSRVVVLEDGKVAEEGNFHQLKNQEGGHFANLIKGLEQGAAKKPAK